MTTTTTPVTNQDIIEANRMMLKADREWSLCLVECFGEAHASHMRYTKDGEGVHGSDLNNCYLDFVACREHWHTLLTLYRDGK